MQGKRQGSEKESPRRLLLSDRASFVPRNFFFISMLIKLKDLNYNDKSPERLHKSRPVAIVCWAKEKKRNETKEKKFRFSRAYNFPRQFSFVFTAHSASHKLALKSMLLCRLLVLACETLCLYRQEMLTTFPSNATDLTQQNKKHIHNSFFFFLLFLLFPVFLFL